MSDAKMQSIVQSGPLANAPALEDPAILSITLTNSAGKTLGSPIVIRVPRVLSKKLVKMYLLEMIAKLIRATLDKVVADLGW
jgi:hypothetical protein